MNRKRKYVRTVELGTDGIGWRVTELQWNDALSVALPSFPTVLLQEIIEYALFSIGLYDVLDVQDRLTKWFPAVVVGIHESRVDVHFWSWSPSNYDETIDIDAERFASLGTRCNHALTCTHWWGLKQYEFMGIRRESELLFLEKQYAIPRAESERMWDKLCRSATTVACECFRTHTPT